MKRSLAFILVVCLMLMECLVFVACEKDTTSTSVPTIDTEASTEITSEIGEGIYTNETTEEVVESTESDVESDTVVDTESEESTEAPTVETTEVISTEETTEKQTEETTTEETTTEETTTEETTTEEITTEEATTEAHVHSFGEWKVAVEPSCTSTGVEECVCACGEKDTREMSMLPHAEVVDAAVSPTYTQTGLTEGKHCSKCGVVTVAQEVVPVLPTVYHSIVYKNLNGAESPTETQYAEHTGLLDLPEPTRIGYKFEGWYTKSIGGDIVDYIPAGSTTDYVLFARWNLETYTITYKNAANNPNPKTYTIEDEISLVNPEWAGLIFSRWTDKNGNSITKIPKGITGNIELEANWIYAENLAVSNPDKYTYIGGAMDSQSRYYFIFDIGTIENIILSTQYVQKYDASTNVDRQQSVTYKVQTEEAQSVSQAIANSVIYNQEWNNTSEWISGTTTTSSAGSKFCPELEYAGVKGKIYEFNAGWSQVIEDKYTETSVQINSELSGTQITNQTASSISYLVENETTSMVNVHLSKDISPVGIYSYVRAADVKVYAIVTYDPNAGEYYLDIYSMVYRVFDTTLFELSGNEQYSVNIESCNQLDFEIPYAEIPNMFYTVQYDANGGSGEMLKSVHEFGVASALLPNGYTRDGYTFAGWKTSKDGSTTIYPDGSNIRDITESSGTVTLYAHWIKNTYTVQYNSNKPQNASSSVLNTPQNTTFTYDSDSVLGSQPSLTGWTFGGWYLDAACTVKLGDAGEVITNANLTAQDNGTVTLYAKWTANTYTITYNANGGSGTTSSTKHTYDTTGNLASNMFSKTNCIFWGWSTDSNATRPNCTNTEDVKHLAVSGNVTLYAVWVTTSTSVAYTDRTSGEITSGSGSFSEAFYPGLDREALIANGYTALEMTFHVYGEGEKHIFQVYDKPYIEIYSYTDELLAKLYLGDYPSGGWAEHYVDYTISLNNVQADGSFWVRYGNDKSLDHWKCGTVEVYITAIK